MTGVEGAEAEMERLRPLRKEEVGRAAAMLADAFRADPVWNAVVRDEADPHARMRRLFETPLRYCLKHGRVWTTGDALEGVLAWVPGERADMTVWRLLLSGAWTSGMGIGPRMGVRLNRVFGLLQKDRRTTMDGVPYVYLQVIGVAPKHQGKGHGGRLIRALLKECERQGRALYLETETEANVRMYERFGLCLIRRVTVPVVDLPMWEMVGDASGDGGRATRPSRQ